MTLMISLEEQEQSILFALIGNAMLIYWNHGVGEFTYLIGSDKDQFHEEIKLLRLQFQNRTIATITAGDTLSIDNTDLYSMELEIPGHQCNAYFLLGKTGDLRMADKTPYFFKSRATRDKTIAYLTKSQQKRK